MLLFPSLFLLLIPLVNGGRYKRAKESSSIDENDDKIPEDEERPIVVKVNINSAFENKRTFACPKVKPDLHTGDDVSNISPEDIDIVAAMGDSLAAGRGLWTGAEVDFRGAAFPIGGDANIDGLVTLPNILLEFNDRLEGVSHGMGDRKQLPDYQLNVAVSGSQTDDLPEQANELVSRMHRTIGEASMREKWALVVIATGTEEFCELCDTPNHKALRQALGILRKGIPKVLVVLLGPVHVASSYSQNINLLKPRCSCLESTSKAQYLHLLRDWKRTFVNVQDEFNSLKYGTFGVLAIPQLTIHSREPDSLFVDNLPLLNRKGHTYAAKWLWNRLIYGPHYNVSDAVFSVDAYYCPPVGCPYFRTVQNWQYCSVITEFDYQRIHVTTLAPNATTKVPHRENVRRNLIGIVVFVVFFCFISVCLLGTIFYRHSLEAHRAAKKDPHSDEAAPLPEVKLGG